MGRRSDDGRERRPIRAAHAEAAYRQATTNHLTEETFAETFAAQHAFTHELLIRTDFPNKHGLEIQVFRTENSTVLQNYQVTRGARGVKIERGPIESTSIFRPYSYRGQELTVQRIPIHRALGAYFQERAPGFGAGAFAGDRENEIVAFLDDIVFDYD